MSKELGKSENPLNKRMRDEFIDEIYEAAVIYYHFLPPNKNNIEIDDVYMISKEFIDYFKEKIKYNENKDLFKEKNDDNHDKFYQSLINYSLNELEAIVFSQITIYGDLNELEDDIDKGFEFVTKDFLDSLEVDLKDENNNIDFEDYKVKYIKEENNIIIIFKDDSKLIICNDKNGTKYHAIPAPIISIRSSEKKTFKRTNTICITRKRDKTVIVRKSPAY